MNPSHPFLIVGGGMAGLTLAHEFRKSNIPFQLCSDLRNKPASAVAGGMFSPMGGKRFQINTHAEAKLQAMYEFFSEMIVLLGKDYLVHAPMIQAFSNVKESNDFFSKLEDSRFNRYADPDPVFKSPLICELGAYGTRESGWVMTEEFISDSHAFLKSEGSLLNEKFNPKILQSSGPNWVYKGNTYRGIIFCEGYELKDNPWFSWVPFKWSKGQILLIQSKELQPDEIIKRSVYLVPHKDNLYKLGATYEWDFEDANPTLEGKEMLLSKMKSMVKCSFEVVDHIAGIRPATRDRNPVLGEHPMHHGLYIYNGLGAKGILQGPYTAKVYSNYLLHQKPLPPTYSLSRFSRFFLAGQTGQSVQN